MTRRRALLTLAGFGSLTASLLSGCLPGRPLFKKADFRRGERRQVGDVELDPIDTIPENSIRGPQRVDRDTYRLKIEGLVENPREYTYEQLMNAFPLVRRNLRIDCVEGWSRQLLREGVRMNAVLESAGVKPQARTIIFRAHDGYSTSLALDYVTDRDMLLGYRVNGLVLPPERGFPFQLIAEGSWGYKWCKWIEEIEVSSSTSFRGYWESRGYSRDGSLDRSFVD